MRAESTRAQTGTGRQFFRTGLFLLAAAVASGNIGNMGRSFSDLATVSILALFAIAYLPAAPGSSSPPGPDESSGSEGAPSPSRITRTLALLSLLLVSGIVLILAGQGITDLLGLAVFLFAFDWILRELGKSDEALPALLLTLFMFGLLQVLLAYVPLLWQALNRFALTLSHLAGLITGRGIGLGITYSGLMLLALFFLYQVSVFLFSSKKKLAYLLAGLITLFLVDLLYLAACSFIVRSRMARVQLGEPVVSAYDWRLLLFILFCVATYLYVRSAPSIAVPAGIDGRRGKRLAVAVAFLVLSLMVLTVQIDKGRAPGRVVLYDTGHIDFNVPNAGRYGLRNIGMFGMLPRYLEARGYRTRTVTSLTGESLAGAGTLVIISPNRPFTDKAKRAVWEFVDDGGSLLVLGDHTDMENLRGPLNDLLNPVGIKYAFDSAIPLKARWEHSFELSPNQVLRGMSENQLQIGIGASLEVAGDVKPVVVGRYGYSDKGNRRNAPGNLGNMRFSPDERLGDLVLVAEAGHGKGRVLAFGDTTPFQNGGLLYSYDFVDRTFDWLRSGTSDRLYPFNALVAIVLLAVSLVVLLSRGAFSTVSVPVCILVLLVTPALLPPFENSKPSGAESLSTKVAYIDVSHIEQCALDVNSPRGIDGLAANLARSGFTPLILRDFSARQIADCDVLALVAPAKPFNKSETECLRRFVGRGGLLIVCAGWEERQAVQPVLQKFGLRISDTPLGSISPGQNERSVSLYDAWPVVAKDGTGSETLVKAWDYPLVVFRRYGKGGVLAAGDSSFLLNENLEGVDEYIEKNVLFIGECLDRFGTGRPRD